MSGLIIRKFRKTFFCLIDCLQEVIADVEVDISSLVKVKNHRNISTVFKGLRLEGKFVSKNVIDLSIQSLTEVSFLSVPSTNKIDQAKFKRKFKEYGRKLRLIKLFYNGERTFTTDKFRPKSSFNPRDKDAIIENYLSCLEERLLDIQTSHLKDIIIAKG